MYNPQGHITNGELSVQATKFGVVLKQVTGLHDSGSPIITLSNDMIRRIVEAQQAYQAVQARADWLDHGGIDQLFINSHP